MSMFSPRRSSFGLSSVFSRRKRRPQASARPARRRYTLELLEDRSMLATLTVNNLSDAVSPGAGQVTLRQAIVASESQTATALGDIGTGNDTIVFAAGLEGAIDLSQVGDSSMGPSALIINNNDQLTIDGANGGTGITIDRDTSVSNLRLFDVAAGASLTLESLTLAGGQATGAAGQTTPVDGDGGGGGGGAGLGGAIFNQGTLNLLQDTLTGNTAQGGAGGDAMFESLEWGDGGAGGGPNAGEGGFSEHIIAENGGDGGFASGGGGGGSAIIICGSGGQGGFGGGGGGGGSSIEFFEGAGGSAGFGGGAGDESSGFQFAGAGGGGAGLGGALFNEGGSVTITDSTFAGNSAQGGAGGEDEFDGGASGQGIGGALFNHNGTVTVLNSTIASNSADAGAGGVENLADGQTATLTLNNTIVADNTVDTTEADMTGDTTAAGGSVNTTGGVGNLVIQQTGFAGTFVSSSDPGLSALAANGGPTQTMAIDPTSPAYHAGNAAAATGLSTDQRGAPRFSTGDLIDIGAYQTNPAPSAEAGGPYQINVGDSLHLDASASADPDGDTLTFSWDVNGDGTFGDATGVSPTLTWGQLNALGINGPFSTANLRVEVSDGVNPPVASSTTSLEVVDAAAPTDGAGVALTGNERSALSSVPVATFNASAGQPSPGEFAATIDWGDGSSAPADAITVANGVYTVMGSHTFADEGKYDVQVTIDGNGGGPIVVSTTATIHEELMPDGSQGTADQRWVSELYRDLLGRQVDASGLAHWTRLLSAGTTRAEIVLGIEQTSEYLGNEVQAAFQQYLHRDVDAAGLDFFVGMLARGSIEQLDQALLSSDEYFIVRGGGTNDGFFSVLFQDLLNRPVDAPTLHWLDSLMSNGISRQQVVSTVYGSLERQQDLARQLYEQFLDRSPDSVGMTAIVNQLHSGGSISAVEVQILSSAEYFQKANV